MRKDVSFAYDELRSLCCQCIICLPQARLTSATVYKLLGVLSLWYVTVQSICDYLCVSADECVCVCVCVCV